LGIGGVYRARDLALDRKVAVKLLSERYPADSPAAQRFLLQVFRVYTRSAPSLMAGRSWP
jgi:hypothetical protein